MDHKVLIPGDIVFYEGSQLFSPKGIYIGEGYTHTKHPASLVITFENGKIMLYPPECSIKLEK